MDRRVDLSIAVVLVVAGLAWLYGASLIRRTESVDPIGESGFPIALGLLFVVGGLIIAVRVALSLRRSHQPAADGVDNTDEDAHPVSAKRPLLIWGACALWVLALEPIGFLLATPLLLAAELWLLEFRRPIPLVSVALVTTIALFVILDILLKVSLPVGPLAPFAGRVRL
ncbi:MAG: tripartite tricarboxylate transporter TctB family protein [Chloroflexi bacterium]|nr:tripartite tricarboxylate transporter TctB family protein [Chloroflexota bacterium]